MQRKRVSSRDAAARIPAFAIARLEIGIYVSAMFRVSADERHSNRPTWSVRRCVSVASRSGWLLGVLAVSACSGGVAGSESTWGGDGSDTSDVTGNPSGQTPAGGNNPGTDTNGVPGTTSPDGTPVTPGAPGVAPGGTTPGAVPPGSTSGGGGTDTGSGTDTGTDTLDPDSYLVPTRIRRLSNLEYANSIRALLGTSEAYEASLPADVRQRNFTVNQAQTVSSDWNAAVETLAKQAAAKVITDGALTRLSPCSEASDACATQFIDSFAGKAFRRPVAEAERAGLLSVYQQGAVEGGFNRGAELVIATVLQAPSFMYLTELGDGAAVSTLSGDEVASLLAYVTTKAPPDAQLAEAGRSGALADAAARGQHARRLLATEPGKTTLEDFIVEWFTSDWVLNASKDNIPEFNQQRSGLYDESRNFVRTVIDNHQGDFKTLLTADFTVVTPEVASYYGIGGSGQVSLAGTPRLGITTAAAFLGGHSSPTHSSPVKRGAAFMRQVLCTDPPDPSTVNLVVAAPAPDPSKSTRQLFAAHSADATCQACHQFIDPIGFAFEEFDEGGLVRQGPEDNNGYPVDASGTVTIGGQTFTWTNAADFLTQVGDSDLARRCVARTATRFGFAWTNSATELKFVEEWNAMDSAQQTQIGEVLVKLIESDLFVQRKAQ